MRGIAKWKWLLGCLGTFYCYDYGAKGSKVVQKIVTDQNDYHKCSSSVAVCWIAKIYQSITVKKGWLLGHLRHSLKSYRSCTEKGAITGAKGAHGGFYPQGKWSNNLNRGIASKTKSQNPKQHFYDKSIFFESQAADN